MRMYTTIRKYVRTYVCTYVCTRVPSCNARKKMKLQEGTTNRKHRWGTFEKIVLKDTTWKNSQMEQAKNRKQEDETAWKHHRQILRKSPTQEAEPSWTLWKSQAWEAEPSSSCETEHQEFLKKFLTGRAFVDTTETPNLRGRAFVEP